MSHDVLDENPLQVCRRAFLKGIEKQSLKLPVLPKIAGEIVSLTNNPDAEVSDLSELIHQDQALAGYVLKVANSAAYAGGERIVSLQQAVARLGMRLLGDIALSITLQDEAFTTPGYENLSKKLTRLALISGAYAKEIARAKRRNVEGQFLCGILHTVGMPVTLKLAIQMAKANEFQLKADDVQTLIDEFHTPIGKALTTDWNLPQVIQVTSEFYDNYEEAPAFQDETAMTYLADRLANAITFPEKNDLQSVRQDPVIAYLNFYPDDVDDLLEKQDSVMELVNALEV